MRNVICNGHNVSHVWMSGVTPVDVSYFCVWKMKIWMCLYVYRVIPGNKNWQLETADWNLDVRLDIWVKKFYARLEILLRNSLAGSKTVVSISRDDPVWVISHVYVPACEWVFFVSHVSDMHGNTLQHTCICLHVTESCHAWVRWIAPYCNTRVCSSIWMSSVAYKWYALQHTATRCDTLQHTATHGNTLRHVTTPCNTLQHTATHCNTLRQAATHCNVLQHTATHCNTLRHTATHYTTLQHTATHCLPASYSRHAPLHRNTIHCNTMQHTVTHFNTQQPLLACFTF